MKFLFRVKVAKEKIAGRKGTVSGIDSMKGSFEKTVKP